MTIAMIGWFTKNLAIFYLGCELAVGAGLRFGHCFERLRVDRHARLHLLDSLRHDSLARLQSLLNDPFRADTLADFNRT